MPLPSGLHALAATPFLRVQLHDVLEAHCGDRDVVGVCNLYPVVQPEMTFQNFCARHVPGIPDRLSTGRPRSRQLPSLFVQNDRVIVEMEEEMRHARQTNWGKASC